MTYDSSIVTNTEIEQMVIAAVRETGLTDHIHTSMNGIYTAIRQIIIEQFTITSKTFTPHKSTTNSEQNNIQLIHFEGRFTDVSFCPHKLAGAFNSQQQITPDECITKRLTYCVDVKLSGNITIFATMTDGTVNQTTHTFKDFFAFSIPIEVNNEKCIYSTATRDQIYMSHGDPDLYDGVFIINGQIYVILNEEKLKFNEIQIYRDLHKKQIARAVMLMRETIYRNSYQMICVLQNDGLILCEVTYDQFRDHPIPFTIIFYLLGITSDKQIEDMILMNEDENSPVRASMQQTIQRAVTVASTHALYREGMSRPTFAAQWTVNYTKANAFDKAVSENEKQKLVEDIYRFIDVNFMVHQTMATNRSDMQDTTTATQYLRYKKAQLFAIIIHDQILTAQQQSAGTDRDHLADKRYHTPGHQLTQVVKRMFNICIVTPIREALIAAYSRSNMSTIDPIAIIATKLAESKMLATFESEIKSSTDTINVGTIPIRRTVVAEALSPPKSPLHATSLKRSIQRRKLESTQSARSFEIRAVHPSFCSYICMVTSADTGENVGMNAQMTVLTTITGFTSIETLRQEIFNYRGLVYWQSITTVDLKKYTLVYINGDLYGGLTDTHLFIRHFRKLRRDGVLDRYMSITYDTKNNRINFWTDEGRLVTPFFAVYSNEEEIERYDSETAQLIAKGGDRTKILADRLAGRPKFYQYNRYTQDVHRKLITQQITFMSLVDDGIIEYITAEEFRNCILAEDYKILYVDRHNETRVYTHMLIPLNMYGLPALSATLPTMSDSTRHCYQTNMGKQTNSFIGPNQTSLEAKQMITQMNSYRAINPTPGNEIGESGGAPAVIAFACMGHNGEDSLVFNEGFVQRGGFLSINFNNVVGECRGSDEFFGNPPENTNTITSANRSKLRGGIHVPVGVVIENGDVVIAKYVRRTHENGHVSYSDVSVIYQHHETAYVSSVTQFNLDAGGTKIVVKYRIVRLPIVGSKFSSRSGNKGVISIIIPASQMNYGMFTGRTPDIIINSHSFPSRMLPGEKTADFIGECATRLGCVMPVSPFMEIDATALFEIAKKKGNKYGLEPLRDYRSGGICRSMFMVTSFRQALQKFSQFEASARSNGRLDPRSHNSAAGAQNGGGMRTGEMEFYVLGGHGAANALDECQRSGPTKFDLPICTKCGTITVYNEARGIALCKICTDSAYTVKSDSKFVTNSIVNIMMGIGIKPEIKPAPYTINKLG